MSGLPIAIIGGGPIGLSLALLLAYRSVPSVVFDARTNDEARRDRRLLALSRGTLDALGRVVALPTAACAPIRSVVVSSRGEFGRAVIEASELGGAPLGATIRYGDLLDALDRACSAQPLVTLRRPCLVEHVQQAPQGVRLALADGSAIQAVLAINAEGAGARRPAPASQFALIADVEVKGLASGTAVERFTRDGPLALLPRTASGVDGTPLALVWCMSAASAERRERLRDDAFAAELATELGERGARIQRVHKRARYPLIEEKRARLREHRVVHVGNAAQTLHPVAGQGFNLGVRDCVTLADCIAQAIVANEDPLTALPQYERARRADRLAIGALTRAVPSFFATRFAPVAAARSLGLTMLSIVPNLRVDLARLLMFGVRS